MSGNVIFTWTASNVSYYDVELKRNEKMDVYWKTVYETKYNFTDVLLYNSTGINVRLPGSPENNLFTYSSRFAF